MRAAPLALTSGLRILDASPVLLQTTTRQVLVGMQSLGVALECVVCEVHEYTLQTLVFSNPRGTLWSFGCKRRVSIASSTSSRASAVGRGSSHCCGESFESARHLPAVLTVEHLGGSRQVRRLGFRWHARPPAGALGGCVRRCGASSDRTLRRTDG